MNSAVETVCPKCNSKLLIEYKLLGASTTCPSCGRRVVPQVPVGTEYPNTEYEITFADFHQLLAQKDYRNAVGELLAQWFGYEITDEGESTVVLSRDGKTVDILDLHLEIQNDSTKQRKLYKTAMALWH